MNSSLVVVGSLNADFVIGVSRYPVPGETIVGQSFAVYPGGKGANQAYAAGRLGARVAMVGQVGNDAQGPWLRQNLAAVGVNVSEVRTDPGVASGIATITIDASGQNEIIIVPGANGTLHPDRLLQSGPMLASAGFLLLQLEVPLPTVEMAARLGKKAGATVILDPAPAQPLSDELLSVVDYLTPNETELALLTGAVPGELEPAEAACLARQLLLRGVRTVIVKLGARGAVLVEGEREHFWPAIRVKAVDTTAAGDAFNAAFAAALARGMEELDAGAYAVAAAACSVTRVGAQPSMPTPEEVERLLGATRRGASASFG